MRGACSAWLRRAKISGQAAIFFLVSAIAAGSGVAAGQPAISGIIDLEARLLNGDVLQLRWRYGRPLSEVKFFHIFRESFALQENGAMRDFKPMARIDSIEAPRMESSGVSVSYTDLGAIPGSWQCYRVQAVGKTGDAFPMSPLVCVFLTDPKPESPESAGSEPVVEQAVREPNQPQNQVSAPKRPQRESLPEEKFPNAPTHGTSAPEPVHQPPSPRPDPSAKAETPRPEPSPCGEVRENQIEGKVTRSGYPVAGLEVLMTYRLPGIPAYKYYTHTDENGRYCFTGLEFGEIYRISIALPTIKASPNRHKIKLKKGREAGADFVVEP